MFQHHIWQQSSLRIAIEHRIHKILEELSLRLSETIPKSNGIYLAIITSFKLQFWSLGIRIKLPSFEKYFLVFRPRHVNFLGNLPRSYIIWARWSSFFPKESLLSFLGLNRSSPVSISKVMQASDHISAVRLYLDPVKTSGPRYCLVWI